MINNQIKRISQVTIAVFLLACVSFSQIGAGGGMGATPITGEKLNSSLPGQLGGILDKTIFSKVVKKNYGTAGKSKSTAKSQKAVAGSKTARDTSRGALNILSFRPNGDTGFDDDLADLLTKKPDEKAALLLVFKEGKKAYQSEALKMGRKNDLALALTFFISTTVTVYHDSPEPTDQATENLYQLLAETLTESPEILQMSDGDKQLASDKLIYISSLLLAGYLVGKSNSDPETLKLYRQSAGICLQSLLGVSAEKMIFDKTGLKIRS